MDKHEIAMKGAQERWNPSIPRATHTGTLIIAGQEIQCDVLEDGRRILRQKTLIKAMGKGPIGGYDQERGKDLNLPVFLTANNLRPYLGDNFKEKGASLINYKGINGQKLSGYEAILLPEVCKIYAKAFDEGVLKNNQQQKIAAVCRAMLYGLATVGIVALIDDATGYVQFRAKTELQKILEAYVLAEMQQWTKTFPDEFFKQTYRLHGWEYPKINKNHPQYIGKIINEYIYERLPEGVFDELKNRNPKDEETGRRKGAHHQLLTPDVGKDNLSKQITQVITVMKLSDSVEEFKEKMKRL